MRIIIQNGKELFEPVVVGTATWKTERRGSAGVFSFSVLRDKKAVVRNGSAIRVSDGKVNIFYGFIFKISVEKENLLQITAYDQLRYLQNAYNCVFSYQTASDVIQKIADYFRLNVGVLAETRYKSPSRIEENTKCIDIILSALDDELSNTGKFFVLYDDFGKLTLKSPEQLQTNVLIDDRSCQNAEMTETIDQNVYNRIKLYHPNETTGKFDIYTAQDGENINRWGVLEKLEKIENGENGRAKSDALLGLYDKERRSLQLSNVFGDWSVRAGSLVVVHLSVGGQTISGIFMVEKCTHTVGNGEHLMDLSVVNSVFNEG